MAQASKQNKLQNDYHAQMATGTYMKKNIFLFFLIVMFSAQVFGKDSAKTHTSNTPNSQEDYQLLFLGNSHSAFNGLPNLVSILIEAGRPGISSYSGAASDFKFLDERLNDGKTQKLLESRAWTHVTLQAQKYSSSGQFSYSTAAAEEWIRRVRAQNARPILFPEWPRRGNKEEGQRVHDLHLSISSREPACVAPIGLAWEASLARFPKLGLHAADGNHSNLTGALLTAYVLYHVTTGQSAADLPYIPAISVNANTQKDLRELAADVVIENQTGCADINLTNSSSTSAISDPRIPTLNHWGLLVLALSMVLIGIKMR